MSRFAAASIEYQFDVIPEAMADRDHVFAAGTILAAASAAELHGVPFRFVAYTPAILPSAVAQPGDVPHADRRRAGVNRLLWWVCLRGWQPAGTQVGSIVGACALGLPPVRDVFANALSERPILAVDRPARADARGLPRSRIQQIRGLHRAGGEVLPAKLEAFLEAGPPPVYIGFGSMTDSDPDATTRAALLGAVDRVGCRALISEGWAGLGERARCPRA